MRILHLSDRASARGGADLYLCGLLRQLRDNHRLLLAVGRREAEASATCPVVEVPGLTAPARAEVRRELDAVAADFRPDVIHVHNAMNPEALEWAASRGALATVHDHRCFCPGRGKLTKAGAVCRDSMNAEVCASCFDDDAYFRDIYERTEQRLRALRAMSRIVVLSRYMRDELAAVGVAPDRIAIVPPFVHTLDPDAAPSGSPCILFAGRLVSAKGVDDAVAAWRAADLDLPLVFAGTGPERARLEAEGLAVLGWQPLERMSGIYRRAAVLVMPPRWQEPFGIAGLEALHMGVPVAAWESGGIREWHPHPVPWGDVDALASALHDAIGTQPTAPAGFDPARSLSRMLAVYREVGS